MLIRKGTDSIMKSTDVLEYVTPPDMANIDWWFPVYKMKLTGGASPDKLKDFSGNAKDTVVQATSGFRATVVDGAINGKQALQFDGADYYQLDLGTLNNVPGFTTFLVYSRTGTAAEIGALLYYGSDVLNTPLFQLASDQTIIGSNAMQIASRRLSSDSSASYFPTRAVLNAWNYIIVNIDYVNDVSYTIQNNVVIGSGKATGTAEGGNTASLNSDQAYIGAAYDFATGGPGFETNSRIADTAVWKRSLNAGEMHQLRKYIKATYNL